MDLMVMTNSSTAEIEHAPAATLRRIPLHTAQQLKSSTLQQQRRGASRRIQLNS